MKKSIFFSLIFLCIIKNINAQNIDSISVAKKDTLKNTVSIQDTPSVSAPKKARFIPVPKKALLYSIAPGGGQIYNRKYWYLKLPVVYTGFGVGVYLINFNTSNYRLYKTNYFNKVNNLEVDPRFSRVTPDRLKNARDGYFKQLQQSYVFISVWYILTGVEAFTAAHLMNFDVDENLSLQFKPSFMSSPFGTASGIGVSMRFK
jgi:hypothetical protein